jgi:flap endonuclease-1
MQSIYNIKYKIYKNKLIKMGIKHLNKFFKENADNALTMVSLSALSGKKIAVDISIYMYRYLSDGTLIENMYLMLSVFKYYNIIPIFIFDGKPPDEKMELLKKRRNDKKNAEKEYNSLKNELELKAHELSSNDKKEIIEMMDTLKKRFCQISKENIEVVKSLIRSYGATYYDAPGEADELCAMLTIKGKVWACLSEDMDMFIYGCPYVIRYMSLLNHTAVIYDTKKILENVGLTQKELREICVLSGTDYSNKPSNNKNKNLYDTLKIYKKYHNSNKEEVPLAFYDWLLENTDYIQDVDSFKKIYEMFDLSNNTSVSIKPFESVHICYGPSKKKEMKEILERDGFIFPM